MTTQHSPHVKKPTFSIAPKYTPHSSHADKKSAQSTHRKPHIQHNPQTDKLTQYCPKADKPILSISHT